MQRGPSAFVLEIHLGLLIHKVTDNVERSGRSGPVNWRPSVLESNELLDFESSIEPEDAHSVHTVQEGGVL
jgi:hypothetical protein